MPINLYDGWPSARRSADLAKDIQDEVAARRALDAAEQRRIDSQRPTVIGAFDPDHHRKVRDAREKRQRADRGLIAQLLSGLVMGKIIGLNLPGNAFDDVWGGFVTTLQQLGLTVQPPAPAPNSANRSELRALALGVSPEAAKRVQPATPRSRRKFDEFLAAMPPAEPTLAAALAQGSTDGIPPGIVEAISAMIGGIRAASLAGDGNALRLIGEDFGALAAALMAATAGSSAQRSEYVTVRKIDPKHPRGAITEIEWPDGKKTKTRLASLYETRKG